MSRKDDAPVVAELGRPETPEETAARKAEFSRNYRSSQTFRSLIAALIATLAILAVIVFAVPRGEPASEKEIDLDRVAADVAETMDSPVIVPDVETDWRVNAARLEGDATAVWNVTIAPRDEDERGFIRVAQAFDATRDWAPQVLGGFAPTGTQGIGGLEWDVYDIGSRGEANIRYALGVQAGDDYVLLYGSRTPESTADLAESLAAQITTIKENG